MIGLLTVRQAAEAAGISPRHMRNWLRAREKVEPGIVVRLGARKWRVDKAALGRLLGIEDEDLMRTVARHGRRLDELERRLHRLEGRRPA